MKIIPIFRISNMKAAIEFYTGILDFKLKYPDDHGEDGVVDLINGEAELQLTNFDGNFSSIANVNVDNVDSLFAKYKQRGLDTTKKPNSPVHQGPIDQTWGRREFYVTDADGNTLRFYKPLY